VGKKPSGREIGRNPDLERFILSPEASPKMCSVVVMVFRFFA
jgi:hypothetical protein